MTGPERPAEPTQAAKTAAVAAARRILDGHGAVATTVIAEALDSFAQEAVERERESKPPHCPCCDGDHG